MRGSLGNLFLASFVVFAMVLAACSTGSNESPSARELPEGFAPAVYPPPVATLAEGGAILAGCPNPSGLEELEGVPDDTAIALLESLWSEVATLSQRASDPALWPILTDLAPRQMQPQPSWFDGPAVPASLSQYARSLAQQCGETLVNASWTFTVCPGPCINNTSASLKEDVFVLSRAGQLLIWAIWP